MAPENIEAFIEEINRDAMRLLDATHKKEFHAWLKAHTGEQEIIANGKVNHRLAVWLRRKDDTQLMMEIGIIRSEVLWWHHRQVEAHQAKCFDTLLAKGYVDARNVRHKQKL